MQDFTNPSKRLRGKFNQFMEIFVTPGLSKPEAKLCYDVVWGVLASGAVTMTEISRASCPGQRLKSTEARISAGLQKFPVDRAEWDYAGRIVGGLCAGPARFDIDESDISKPHGKGFENLCRVHDGSVPGKTVCNGFPVTGVVALLPSGQPIPVLIDVYSYSADGFKTVGERTLGIMGRLKGISPRGRVLIMDRWYDSGTIMDKARDSLTDYVVRGKSIRKYSIPSGKSGLTGAEVARLYKGKYVSRFEGSDGRNRKQRFYSSRVASKNLPGGSAWLVFEWLDGEPEPRWYLTSLDASTRAGCAAVIALYRKRWRVEETFRFLKQLFGIEGIMALGYNSIRSLVFLASVAMGFLAWVIEAGDALFLDAMSAHQDTRDGYDEAGLLKEFGNGFLKVYRVARGVMAIASHVHEKPRPKEEKRPKKGDVVQLRLKLTF